MRDRLSSLLFSPRLVQGAAMLLGLSVLVAMIVLNLMQIAPYPDLNYYESTPLGGDFWPFYAAGQLTAAGLPWGAYVQEMNTAAMASQLVEAQSGPLVWGLYYPPTYLFLLWPFAYLPYYTAYIAFFVLSLVVFLGGLWLICRRPWLVMMMLAFMGVVMNFIMGQNGLLTAGLFAIALGLMKDHKRLSGMVIGLLSIKPQLGLLLPFALLIGGEWKVFKTALITTLVLLGASLAAFSLITWVLWPDSTLQASTYLTNRIEIMLRMPSVLSAVRLANADWLLSYLSGGWLSEPQAALLLHSVVAVPVAILILYVWRRTENINLRGAVYAAGTLLITPFLYDYDHAWLAIPIVMLGLEAGRTGWWGPERLILPLAMLWPILINRLPMVTHMQLGFVMPLLLVLLAFRRARREPKILRAEEHEIALNQAA